METGGIGGGMVDQEGMMKGYAGIIAVLLLLSWQVSHACDSGFYVESVAEQGEKVLLDDGSGWRVLRVDRVYTKEWQSTDRVIVCEDEGIIINTTASPVDRVAVDRMGMRESEEGTRRDRRVRTPQKQMFKWIYLGRPYYIRVHP